MVLFWAHWTGSQSAILCDGIVFDIGFEGVVYHLSLFILG